MRRKMVLATVVSPDWMKYTAVTMFSLFRSNPPPVKLYVFSAHANVSDVITLHKIAKSFGGGYEFVFHDLDVLLYDRIYSGINVTERFTRYSMVRLLLPELVPESRVLYVDGDAMVVGDIRSFFHGNFAGNWMIGVEDTGVMDYHKAEIGLRPDSKYINSGVALLNLREIRARHLETSWLHLANTKYFLGIDQDIWNLTMMGHIGYTDFKYNVSLSTSLEVPREDIRIIHWAGVKNPWVEALPKGEIWTEVYEEYKRWL